MKWLFILLHLLVVTGVAGEADATGEEGRRRQFLEEMVRWFPESKPWEDWLESSGELPPDFTALPSVPFLPDPLRFESGEEVTALRWKERRREIMALFQLHVWGSVPPSPPEPRVGERRSREEPGSFVEELTLEFGPDHRAQLGVELIIPKAQGPFPVFVTQQDQRQWALVAVSRGYMACVYAGSEARDDTREWKRLWPLHDWGTLVRRAWAVGRCVDYLRTLPFVDQKRIGLAGHSRNGKVALMAAAFDPRIGAVIASSSGVGGACSFRLFSEAHFGDGIELVTRRFPDWFHPRLRFYAGRENRLPVDQAQLVACIAPRPCLIASAVNDSRESIWAVEHTYQSARRVYQLLERGEELNLLYREGGHETRANDVETYLDWLDTVFERKQFAFHHAPVFPSYGDWKAIGREEIRLEEFPAGGMGGVMEGADGGRISSLEAWVGKRGAIRERILWGLGRAPSFAQNLLEAGGHEPEHLAELLGRAEEPEGIKKRALSIGNGVRADLYSPVDLPSAQVPAVIWVHPISVATGYVAGRRRGEHPHVTLARMGFAVLAFDQIGNGSRVGEVRNFYPRYPHWSVLGKQVEDTLAAVEGLLQVGWIDARRIFVLGYGTGAMTALHAAALDERIAGAVSVGGVTSMRRDTLGKGTGGVARWAGWMAFQPRLGAFLGEEERIPYDYHEILAMIAPRPARVFAAAADHEVTLADTIWCVEEATQAYALYGGGGGGLRFQVLDDYNRFSPEVQREVFASLKGMAGL